MKIAIYDPYLDTLGGGEKYMLSIADCLSKKHDVSLLWNDKTILSKIKEKFGVSLEKIDIQDNIFARNLNIITRNYYMQKYDYIIYLSDGSFPLIFNKKLIIHFQFPVEWVKKSLLTDIKLKNVKKIICNSLYTKQYIDKKFNINSDVLYPPIDTHSLYNKVKKSNTLLTVGRYSRLPDNKEFKKHIFMLDSFKKMVDDGLKKWEFVIVTSYLDKDEDEVKKLEERIGKYPIRVLKNIPQDEIVMVYKEAKIYWHAAGYQEDVIKYPERAEHFGMSTVEAMAAGVVPVVINVGGQKETVNHAVNGFLWDTQQQLIEYTLRLIDDERLLIDMSKEAEKSADNFSSQKFCNNINKLIV